MSETPPADCLFCRILSGAIPARVIASSDNVVAFRDVNPQAPTHVLVIPRAHHVDLAALAEADPMTCAELHSIAAEVAQAEGLAGYRLVANTGVEGGQAVFHAHLHLMGGRPLGWPPG